LAVIIRRRAIFFRQFGDFFDEPVDLPAGLFEKINVDLRFRTCAHGIDLFRM
jgi:hypothetical protein